MNKEKRIRSSNFNKEEELLLVEEIGKFKDIIECKTTNKISSSEKEEAWQKVMRNFNAKNFEVRSLNQIKSKYDNLKTKARKEFAKYKAYLRSTGGGPSIKDELDPVIQAILDIINLKTVVGLSSLYDNDCEINNMMSQSEDVIMEVVPSEMNNYDEDILNATQSEDIVLINQYEAEPPSPRVTELADISIVSHYEVDSQNHNVSGTTFLDHSYVTPLDIASTSSCSTPLRNKTSGHQQIKQTKLSPKEQQESTWSKYVPSRLKKQTSSKLRPAVPNSIFSAKEKYYKRKLELLEQSFEKENMEREKRIKREEEEHQAKMIIHNLEMELKKLELENLKKKHKF